MPGAWIFRPDPPERDSAHAGLVRLPSQRREKLGVAHPHFPIARFDRAKRALVASRPSATRDCAAMRFASAKLTTSACVFAFDDHR